MVNFQIQGGRSLPNTNSPTTLLNSSHILYVGDPEPRTEPGGPWAPEALRRRFDIILSFVSADELLRRTKAIAQTGAAAELEDWRSSFSEVNCPDADLLPVVWMYLVLRELVWETSADALAVRCLAMRDDWRMVPCLALARLLDEGIVASCEADIPATIAMLLLHRLSDGPVLMGNFGAQAGAKGAREGEVSLNHCLIPLSMSSDPSWRVRDYHGDLGVTGYADLQPQQAVTLLHLTSDLEELRLLEGTTQGSSEGVGSLCRVVVHVRPDGDVSRVPREILDSGHMAVGFGHWADALEAMARERGLGVRRL